MVTEYEKDILLLLNYKSPPTFTIKLIYTNSIVKLGGQDLKKIKINYIIKEFETSRVIDGNKKKFKNSWKIIKIVE